MRCCLLGTMAFLSTIAFGQPWSPPIESDLKFDDLFPRMPFFGKQANGFEWSHDSRYLGYIWNPYEAKSSDLWVFDSKTGKSKPVTNISLMAEFDPEAKKAIDRYRKEDRERDERLKLSDKDYREAMIKLKKEQEDRKAPLPSYPGVQEYAWSHKGDDLLFVYRGDLYRWKIGDEKPTRLTKTRDSESSVSWMPNDDGFYFRRGPGLYRMKFDSPYVEQLDPKLPNDLPLWSYSLSPDGTKMMLMTGKSGTYKLQEWGTYKGRFVQIRRDAQYMGTSDEKIQEERYLYLYDLTAGDGDDNKPWEVWRWKSEGDEILDVSVNEKPWSPDSKKFVFAPHNDLTRDIEIQVADLSTKKIDSLYKSSYPGESTSADQCLPFYTADGTKVVCELETTGWRLPWMIDTVTKSARAIVQGEFEAHPIKLTPDGKDLIVWSSALDVARNQVYRVSLEDGKLNRLTDKLGDYGRPAVSDDARKFALRFRSWSSPTEAFVVEGGRENRLTESHRPGAFDAVNKLKPQLFTYKNRSGQTIHGYVFLPPGFKKEDKRPCMVYTYGGPLGNGVTVSDGSFASTDYLLGLYLSYAMGYVSIAIDPRGTSNYGAAFVRASFGHVGEVQCEDLVDCAKFAQGEWGVDPSKMALNGWSFGGWQTQYVMYHEPDVYTLGIAGAGPTEWQNYNQGYTQETIAIQPEGKVEELDKFSLTKVAMNLKHPLLLLHGMDDENVLFLHTVKVYQVLCQYGLAPLVELVLDPTGSHGLGGDLNRRDTLALYVEFLLKHWGNPTKK
ncbi:MAG: S9 family peptidase [Armatimonadetes bacterium]|nr:S9 family peptidase [Armatimonadota bacterium]